MSFLSKIIIIIFIILNISIVEVEGECNSFVNPSDEEDCLSKSNDDNQCCFVTIIKEDNSIENKCWSIEKDLIYFLNYLTVFDYGEYKNIRANFSCNQTDQSCGIDNPRQLYECSEHSSKQKSCCMLKTPTKTNCVMSQIKFDDGTNKTIFDNNYILCYQKFLFPKFIYLSFILVLCLL